jgi:cytochrome c-type biogenesis protein CcmH
MTVFLICFAALVVLALLILLPPLMRRNEDSGMAVAAQDPGRANLAVLREQLAALDAERAAGMLDAEQHRLARIEIERRALEEEQVLAGPAVDARANKTAIALGVSIPFFVLVIYALVGYPQAMLPQPVAAAPSAGGEVTSAQIAAMVESLSKRLESKTTVEAGDLQAWTMLARSYAVLQRYPEASRAYARARSLAPDDAQLMADQADVLAMAQNQSLVGEPTQLIERALKIDPRNIKTLALAGSAAFERKDFAAALGFWERAQQLAPPGSEFAAGLESSIQQARVAAGGTPAVAALGTNGAGAAVPQDAADSSAAKAVATPATAPTSGVVQLAGALAGKVSPGDTVFVFARAAQGPRMPLAILKRKASELPLTFSLDDSSAMSPEMKLSKFPTVVIGARISRSGDAMPQSGDLIGQIGPVATGSGKLVLVIDAVQP